MSAQSRSATIGRQGEYDEWQLFDGGEEVVGGGGTGVVGPPQADHCPLAALFAAASALRYAERRWNDVRYTYVFAWPLAIS